MNFNEIATLLNKDNVTEITTNLINCYNENNIGDELIIEQEQNSIIDSIKSKIDILNEVNKIPFLAEQIKEELRNIFEEKYNDTIYHDFMFSDNSESFLQDNYITIFEIQKQYPNIKYNAVLNMVEFPVFDTAIDLKIELKAKQKMFAEKSIFEKLEEGIYKLNDSSLKSSIAQHTELTTPENRNLFILLTAFEENINGLNDYISDIALFTEIGKIVDHAKGKFFFRKNLLKLKNRNAPKGHKFWREKKQGMANMEKMLQAEKDKIQAVRLKNTKSPVSTIQRFKHKT